MVIEVSRLASQPERVVEISRPQISPLQAKEQFNKWGIGEEVAEELAGWNILFNLGEEGFSAYIYEEGPQKLVSLAALEFNLVKKHLVIRTTERDQSEPLIGTWKTVLDTADPDIKLQLGRQDFGHDLVFLVQGALLAWMDKNGEVGKPQELSEELNNKRLKLSQRIGLDVPNHPPTIEFLDALYQLFDSPESLPNLLAAVDQLCTKTKLDLEDSPADLSQLVAFLHQWYGEKGERKIDSRLRPLREAAIQKLPVTQRMTKER